MQALGHPAEVHQPLQHPCPIPSLILCYTLSRYCAIPAQATLCQYRASRREVGRVPGFEATIASAPCHTLSQYRIGTAPHRKGYAISASRSSQVGPYCIARSVPDIKSVSTGHSVGQYRTSHRSVPDIA
eukprot:1319166-Rhodomonas_salina.1